MAFDGTLLRDRYDIKTLSVISSTQISSRTTAILSALSPDVPSDGEKPVIVRLTSQSRTASKLISIVEIAKRDLASNKLQCYQYNVLSSQMKEIPRERRNPNGHKGNEHAASDVDDDDENAFQTMGDVSGMKKRCVPVMQIYLSRSPVKELRVQYG
jgi:hypothetical protein